MLYTVFGATGNTGRRIAESLLEAGHRVRAVGRSAERLQPLVQRGAEPCVGEVRDPALALAALAGAGAAYVMVPPVNPRDPHFRVETLDEISEVLTDAVRRQGVAHVVNLSSMCAHRPTPALQVESLRRHEHRFRGTPGLSVVHLRPGYFLENLLDQVEAVLAYGVLAYTLRPDLAVPMVSAVDIASVAAGLLHTREFRGESAVELHGPRDLTMPEVARVLGRAIGRETLAYVPVAMEQVVRAMERGGTAPGVIRAVVEMNDMLNRGEFTPEHPRAAAPATPTSVEDFARGFAEAFRRRLAQSPAHAPA